MFGTFKIVDRKGDTKEQSIYVLNNISEIEKQNYLKKLYKLQKSKKIELICNCNNVPMKVEKEEDFYYLDSEVGFRSKHDKLCYFSASLKYKSKYEKGWVLEYKNSNYAYIPKLDNLYFTKKRYKEVNREYLDSDKLFDVKGNLTFRGFVVKLNLLNWDLFVKSNNRLPHSTKELISFLKYTSKIFYPEKKDHRTLYDYLLMEKKERFKSIPNGSKKFVYGKLKGVKIKKENTLYLSEYTFKVDNFLSEETLEIQSDGLLAETAIEKNSIKISKKSTFIFCGILKFEKGKYELETLELLPTTRLGLFCENMKELKLFSLFEIDNKLFKKEHCSIPEYNNILPNAVILEDNIFKIVDLEKLGELSNTNNFEIFNIKNYLKEFTR